VVTAHGLKGAGYRRINGANADPPPASFPRRYDADDRHIEPVDLRRLQRDLLPAGASSREEIETLLLLDRIGQVDEDWPEYLIETVVQFVLSTSTPPGWVGANMAAWLMETLSRAKPRSAAAVVRAVVKEAHYVDELLLMSGTRGKRRDWAPARGLGRGPRSKLRAGPCPGGWAT
jgi:hypothetical protein